MLPARFTEDLAQMGGAVAGGLGAEYIKTQLLKNVQNVETTSLLADFGIAAVGIFGASQIRGTFASLAEGLALGALGHAGVTLLGFLGRAGAQSRVFYPTYVSSYYSPPAVGSSVLEI